MSFSGEVVPARSGAVLPSFPAQHVIDSWLPATARQLILKGVAAKTLEAYRIQWTKFRLWCELRHRTFAPVSQETMITYLDTWRTLPIHNRCGCSEHRPAPSTAWVWFSAVRFYHGVGADPLPWEMGQQLKLAMKGYAEEMVDLGWEPAQARRVYPDDVRNWVDTMDLTVTQHLHARALILVGWYTAARASDLGRYRLSDVARTTIHVADGSTVSGMQLALRKSKTNKKAGLKIEYRAFGPNDLHPAYCAVRAVEAWKAHLFDAYGITDGPLFWPFMAPGRKGGPGPLGVAVGQVPGYRISGTAINRTIQRAAINAGYPNWADYTEHGIRRGRANYLYELGVKEVDIARHHGWSDNGVLRTYLEESDRLSPTAPGSMGML